MQCAHRVKNSIGGVFLSRFFATHLHCEPVLAYSFYGYLSHPAEGCVRPTWTTSSLQMQRRILQTHCHRQNITGSLWLFQLLTQKNRKYSVRLINKGGRPPTGICERKCLNVHTVCTNFSLNVHTVCTNFGIIVHTPVCSVILLE